MRGTSLAIVLGILAGVTRPATAQVTEPAPGLWHVTGRVSATGCADRCVTRRQRVEQELVVTATGVSGAEGLLPQCGEVSNADLTGVTTLVPAKRHGWLRMRVLQRATFVRFARRCTGYRSLRLQSLAARVRIADDGQSFDEIVQLSGSVVVRGRTATFSASGRIHAERIGDAPESTVTVRAVGLGTLLETVAPLSGG